MSLASIEVVHETETPSARPSDDECRVVEGLAAKVASSIRAFGSNTTSHQASARAFRAWFHRSAEIDGDEALVAYVDTGAAWVAVGDPIGPRYLQADAAHAFVRAARSVDRRAVFVAAEVEVVGLAAEPVGLSPEWSPDEWATTLKRSPKLREQLRRARAKGVTTRFLPTAEPASGDGARHRGLERLAATWLASRRAVPLQFIGALDLEALSPDQEIVVAERDGQIVAAAILSPIFARRGFLLEHLLRAPEAPNGTAESLVDLILKTMLERRQTVLSLGTAPLAGECAPTLRRLRRIARPFYDCNGLFAFKQRLHPGIFRTTYLVFPQGQSMWLTAWDVFAAFAGGKPLWFLVATLLHRVKSLIRIGRTKGTVTVRR